MLMPLLLNLIIVDQTREPAMLNELERHFMPVSSAEMPVPTNRTGPTFFVPTIAISAAGMPETSVESAIEFELNGAVVGLGNVKDVEAILAGNGGRAGAAARARVFVVPNALPVHAHHLQALVR
jgi:hypothetical protein